MLPHRYCWLPSRELRVTTHSATQKPVIILLLHVIVSVAFSFYIYIYTRFILCTWRLWRAIGSLTLCQSFAKAIIVRRSDTVKKNRDNVRVVVYACVIRVTKWPSSRFSISFNHPYLVIPDKIVRVRLEIYTQWYRRRILLCFLIRCCGGDTLLVVIISTPLYNVCCFFFFKLHYQYECFHF